MVAFSSQLLHIAALALVLLGDATSDAQSSLRGFPDRAVNATRRLAPTTYLFYQIIPDKKLTGTISGSVKHNCANTADDACAKLCATECFNRNNCNYFGITPTYCKFAKHLTLKKAARAGKTIYGYMTVPPPELLNRAFPCPTPNHALVEGEAPQFCKYQRTKAKGGTEEMSFYLGPAPPRNCVARKETLFRAFKSIYYSSKGLTNVEDGTVLNGKQLSSEAFGTWEQFAQYTASSTYTTKVKLYTPDTNNKPKATTDTTQWQYEMDPHGRVTGAMAELTSKNLLYKVNAAGNKIHRSSYCWSPLQSRFNIIHGLKSARQQGLPFHAGHVVACQFTNPNGFWNFVVQSPDSNSDMNPDGSPTGKNIGCWFHAENEISKLLKMGCKGTFQASLAYFDVQPQPFTQGALFTQADTDNIYKARTRADPPTTSVAVDYPCAYFYRPHTMGLSFTVTGAEPGTQCEPVSDLLREEGLSAVENDIVVTYRALAYWAREEKDVKKHAFNGLRGLATTTANQCYNEKGAKLQSIQLLDSFKGVLLQVKGTKTCISDSKVVNCGPSVIKYAGNHDGHLLPPVKTTDDVLLTFKYKVAIPAGEVKVNADEDMIDGILMGGDKCAVVNGGQLQLVADLKACTVVQTKYLWEDVEVVTTKKSVAAADSEGDESEDEDSDSDSEIEDEGMSDVDSDEESDEDMDVDME